MAPPEGQRGSRWRKHQTRMLYSCLATVCRHAGCRWWKAPLVCALTNVTCAITTVDRARVLQHVPFPVTRLLFRCGPPWYRPSAVQPTIFCCQANKWLVSVAVSVYWLLILSWSRGWRLALHSPPPCSPTGKVLTLLISLFTALCQNIHLQTLKTSAIARHLQPHKAPSLMPDACTLVFYFLFFYWSQWKEW